MTSGSDDGLVGIKEEDEEDEEERLAKIAKLKELEEQNRQKELHEEWRKFLKEKVELDKLMEKARNGDSDAIKKL